MRFFWQGIATLITLILAPPQAMANNMQLYIAHVGGSGSLFEICANEFAKRANEKLPRGFQVVAAGSSRFGDDAEILAKIKRGEVTFGLPSTIMSSVSPKFGVFELPFLIRNREQVRKISDALLEPVLQPEVRQKGYRILAVWENGFRQITNNVRPIKTPKDLAGLKLRIPNGTWREKVFKTLGAMPVPMPLNDTYQALQSLSVDGQENPLAQINGSKFQEVQHYLTLSDHVYTPAYLITSDQHFAALPRDVQEALRSTADSMRSWVYQTAIQTESELLDRLSETMQTNQINIKAFRAASRPLYGEFARTVPGGTKLISIVAELAQVESAASIGR